MATSKAQSNSIIHQYGNWYTVDGWAVTFGTARRAWAGCGPAPFPSRCTKCIQPTHQRPVYQLHIIRCGAVIASVLKLCLDTGISSDSTTSIEYETYSSFYNIRHITQLLFDIIVVISPYSVAFGVILSLLFCTVEDISTQDGAIGVKFWLRVEQTSWTGTR